MPDSTTTVTTIHLPPDSTALRRHNSIAAASPVNKLSLPATTPSRTTSLELVSLKFPFSTSYTSLRDVLPSPNFAVNSPTSSAYSSQEISIRNRLVKQAAWAYLQPMSASPGGASTPHFLRRLPRLHLPPLGPRRFPIFPSNVQRYQDPRVLTTDTLI